MVGMSKQTRSLARLRQRYAQHRQVLGHIGYISQGSVQDRTARLGGGAGYQWTRKVAQKTVTVALTAEQFTQIPGRYVSLADNIRSFRMIVNGELDDVPEQAFFMVGTIEEVFEQAKALQK